MATQEALTNESINMQPQLITDSKPLKLFLDEESQPGKLILRGEVGRAGIATENGRVYTSKLWQQQIDKLRKQLKERKVLGELDHPSEGRTSLKRVSHVLTDLYLNEDGRVIGEMEILPTDQGKNLEAILRAGCPVGVSSRGYGSTVRNERGEDVVQEDYQLVTFDFVADPADSSAYPTIISESIQGKKLIFEGKELPMGVGEPNPERDNALAKQWADMLDKEMNPDAVDEKEELKKEIMSKIEDMKNAMRDEIKKELLADPEVAGAKSTLESITKAIQPFIAPAPVVEASEEVVALRAELENKDKVISALKEDIETAALLIKDLGYKAVLEESLAGEPDALLIKKAIGDVKKFDSVEDLKICISGIKEEATKRRDQEKVLAERREKLKAAERAQEAQLRQQVDQLTEAVSKAVEVNKELALKL